MSQDIDMIEVIERLTRLETEYKVLTHQHSSISGKLDQLMTRFDRYEAKWGGVMMVASALGALFVLFKTEILRWFGGRQ